jgi:mono/diheme cytochrome c family protein
LKSRGWDALPVWNPRARPYGDDRALDTPLWDGKTPASAEEWVALGREVFFLYPLRAEPLAEWAVKNPQLAAECGIDRLPDGSWPGLVRFADVDGRERVGITCALCHSSVRGGRLVVGAARRNFDYGRLRLAFRAGTGTTEDPELMRRMKSWGPGRADVTEDVDEDPVAIPDLWALKEMEAFTQAGTIRHTGPVALAIRQETQLLHSNHERVRPPRELAWALAMYLYSIAPPSAREPPTADAARGAKLFAGGCASCHSGPGLSGPLVPALELEVDAALANGAARGTGRYRPPALVRVGDAAPYFHHGAVRTLDDVMSPERLGSEFTRGALGPGPVPGHAYGTDWPPEDRAAVVAFLRTL